MFINFLIRKMSTAATIPGRALHYVFKIGDRGKNSNFFRNILGMKVLRHEEFKEGCEAECNGPYDNRWSKTMVGYGPESSHFVIELTYNYGVKSYQMGNDFGGITLKSSEALARAKKANYPIEIEEDVSVLRSPDGYKFYVLDEPQPTNRDPIYEVAINAINLEHSKQYWNGLLQMPILCECENSVTLAYDPAQCQLKIKESCTDIDRAQAYGRIAFGVPMAVLPKIQEIIQEAKRPILKPMITLSTPGKADVTVIILSDPDRHEICFVDEEGFGELSQMEEDGGAHLDKFLRKDPFQHKEDGGAPVADVKKD